jgi:hypothetical protein
VIDWRDCDLETVAVHEDGPTFLKRCRRTKALWHETLHDIRQVDLIEAKALYPTYSA